MRPWNLAIAAASVLILIALLPGGVDPTAAQSGGEYDLTLLLISHDLEVVRAICERVEVMHRGSMVESGRTDDVLSNPTHPYTRSLLDAAPSRAKSLMVNG